MKRGDLELQQTMDIEFSGNQADLEATQEVLSPPVLKSRGAIAPATSSAMSLSSKAGNPVAPERKGLLGTALVLVIGALLAFWVWTILKR